MKKLTLLTLSSLVLSAGLQAQVDPAPALPPAGTALGKPGLGIGRPATLKLNMDKGPFKDMVNFAFRRIHTLDIQAQVREMEINGVKEKKAVAVFSASGAFLYEHSLTNQKLEDWDDIGRNNGFQILPYTIKYAHTGQYYLAVNAFSFRNLNTIQNSPHAFQNMDIFKVIDNLDFFVFKWDKKMSFDRIETFEIDFVNADLKVDFLNSTKKTRYLAFTGGGTLAQQTSKFTLDSGEVLVMGSSDSVKDNERGFGFKGDYRYGLEYNDEVSRGNRLKVKIGASNSYSKGHYFDKELNADRVRQNEENTAKYTTDLAAFKTNLKSYTDGKKAWETANLNGVVTSDAVYKTLSGASKPTEPGKPKELDKKSTKIIRNQMYLTPSIEFAHTVYNEDRPVRYGVGLSANIPVKDTLKGGKIDADFSKSNMNLVNARIFINF